MQLNFRRSGDKLILLNPDILVGYTTVSYIRCKFELYDEDWKGLPIYGALFKSASYNVTEDVLLDDKQSCFVPADVFRHGGVIQVLAYACFDLANYHNAHVATDVFEFFIEPNSYSAADSAAAWQTIASELMDDIENMQAIIAAGVDYNDVRNKPQIESSTLEGNKTYSDLNLIPLSNTDIDDILI